jgi:hypothetical protein
VLRLAMTLNAPTHRQARVLVHDFHSFHWTMTFVTRLRCAELLDVRFVIEANVIRKHVHFDPRHGFIVVISLSQALNLRLVCCNHQVAIHANVETWDRGVTRALSR